jgi:glycosyltransferase involved in cell wall biosynthesis
MNVSNLTKKTRRALIVVSAFNPGIIADMQRARMLAWELPRLGWEVEVLTPRASEVRQDIVEENASAFFAPDVVVHEVGSIWRSVLEALGSRTHVWRTLVPIWKRGDQLLLSKRFDIVYFSTTSFMYFILGAYWKKKYKIPYVIDFHDPWVKEHHSQSGAILSQALERVAVWAERRAVVNADGLIAVSPHYVCNLQTRYKSANPRWLVPRRHAVIPFGALDHDFDEATNRMDGLSERHHGKIDICYVGAGGKIMARSFSLVCRALSLLRRQGNEAVSRLRVRLFGTTYNWQNGQIKILQSLAEEIGVGDLITELPDRVTYRRSVELLLRSDGVIVLGVDDAGYMPSKLFSYALSGKPLLASVRKDGPAYAQLQEQALLGHAIWFTATDEMEISEAARVISNFIREAEERSSFDRRSILGPFLAPTMAQRHANLFEECLTT